MFDYFFLVLVGEDDVKTTYATKSISVDGLLFKADTVAAIDGRELFLLAIKLLHYKKAGIGRKLYQRVRQWVDLLCCCMCMAETSNDTRSNGRREAVSTTTGRNH